MKYELIPAILVKTKNKLVSELNSVSKDVKTVQIDIADNKFVRNTTIQAKDFNGVKKKLKYEVQLMVKDPASYIIPFKKIKANLIIFHIEATKNKKEVLKLIKEIKKHKMKVGIGLNPETKSEKVKPFLRSIDQVLVMTVHPGKSGRPFIRSMLKKISKIRSWNKKIDIEVDGGINEKNVCDCVLAGANKIVVGSAIFKKTNIHKAILELKKRC
jgi:ribulose-phosphate 3-epimerase